VVQQALGGTVTIHGVPSQQLVVLGLTGCTICSESLACLQRDSIISGGTVTAVVQSGHLRIQLPGPRLTPKSGRAQAMGWRPFLPTLHTWLVVVVLLAMTAATIRLAPHVQTTHPAFSTLPPLGPLLLKLHLTLMWACHPS